MKKQGLSRVWNPLALTSPSVLGVLVLATLMLFWLFIYPHGLADNGDFYRVIHNLGLSHMASTEKDDLFRYFNNRFVISPYYVDNQVSYFSSQTIIIWISIQLNRIFLHNNQYDIRFLAALYGVLFLIASWMILHLIERVVKRYFKEYSIRTQRVATYLFTALYIFMFGDFGYLLYFNSFFGEPLFYVSFLLYIAITAKILIERQYTANMLILYVIAALFFIGAKQQGAPLGVIVVPFTLRLLTLSPAFKWKACVFGFAGLIGVTSILTYVGISDEMQYINQYHAVSLGIMKYETNANYMKKINIPPQLMMLKGTTGYEEYPMILTDSPLLYQQMYDRISFTKFVLYYLERPNSLVKVLDDVAHASYNIKPEMVGNFLKSSGQKPVAQSYFFSGWSVVKQHIFPKTFGFIAIFYFVIAGILFKQYISFLRNHILRGRLLIEFIWALQLMSAIQFLTAFIGGGEADLAKHLFYFSVIFDMLVGLSVFEISQWLYHVFTKSH